MSHSNSMKNINLFNETLNDKRVEYRETLFMIPVINECNKVDQSSSNPITITLKKQNTINVYSVISFSHNI